MRGAASWWLTELASALHGVAHQGGQPAAHETLHALLLDCDREALQYAGEHINKCPSSQHVTAQTSLLAV